MNNNPFGNLINGIRIIESLEMVEAGVPYTVRRTWSDRLLSTPWRPCRSTNHVTPMIPRMDAMALSCGTMVMHPKLAELIRKSVKEEV